jgi:hypothetical protein
MRQPPHLNSPYVRLHPSIVGAPSEFNLNPRTYLDTTVAEHLSELPEAIDDQTTAACAQCGTIDLAAFMGRRSWRCPWAGGGAAAPQNLSMLKSSYC